MSRKNAQKPIRNWNTNMVERRTAKIAMRVGRENAITRGVVMSVLQLLRRGFFGRLKWLVMGR